jgi:uncharacterized protein
MEVDRLTKKEDGISFNLVSRHKLEGLNSDEKLQFILAEVKKGKILVLEHGLTPLEQTKLIENTMKEIEEDTFIGVEMDGYGQDNLTFFQKLLGASKKQRITLIGPANLLKMVHKDSHMIQTKIIPGKMGAK